MGTIVGKWILATGLQANALKLVRDRQSIQCGVGPLFKCGINAMSVGCVIHADIQGVDSIRNGRLVIPFRIRQPISAGHLIVLNTQACLHQEAILRIAHSYLRIGVVIMPLRQQRMDKIAVVIADKLSIVFQLMNMSYMA